MIIIISWTWLVYGFSTYKLSSLSVSIDSETWVLMSNHRFILIIWTWTWNIWRPVIIWSSSNRYTMSILPKLMWITVISWTWHVYLFFMHKLGSLGISINFVTWVLIPNVWFIKVIFTWTWHIRQIVVIWSTSDWETLSILTKLIVVIVIAGTWLVHCLSAYHLGSRSLWINFKARVLVSNYGFIWIILSWAWNIWMHVVIGLSSNRKTLCILSELIMIRVVSWSWLIHGFSTNKLSSGSSRIYLIAGRLMSNHRFILIVCAWTWNIWFHVIIWLSSYLETLCILSKLTVVIIVSWTWHTHLLSAYHLSSLSSWINFITGTLISHMGFIWIILSWSWNIWSGHIIWFPSNRETFCILTKLLSFTIVSWTWRIHGLSTNNLSSLTVLINLETWIVVSSNIFVWIVLPWTWNIILWWWIISLTDCEL